MAFSYVKENAVGTADLSDLGTDTSDLVIAITSAPGAGKAVVLFFDARDDNGTLPVPTVTDSKGNTYTVKAKSVTVSTARTWALIAVTDQSAGTLTTSDTITVHTGTAAKWESALWWVEEFSYPAGHTISVDVFATNSGSGTSMPTGTTAATANAAELALANCATSYQLTTKDAGYTQPTTGAHRTTTATLTGAFGCGGNPSYKILSATGTQSATYTGTSASFAGVIVVLKATLTVTSPPATVTMNAPVPTSAIAALPPAALVTAGAAPPTAQATLQLSSATVTAGAGAPSAAIGMAPPSATLTAGAPTPSLAFGMSPSPASIIADAAPPGTSIGIPIPSAARVTLDAAAPTPTIGISTPSATFTAGSGPPATSIEISTPPANLTADAVAPAPTIGIFTPSARFDVDGQATIEISIGSVPASVTTDSGGAIAALIYSPSPASIYFDAGTPTIDIGGLTIVGSVTARDLPTALLVAADRAAATLMASDRPTATVEATDRLA